MGEKPSYYHSQVGKPVLIAMSAVAIYLAFMPVFLPERVPAWYGIVVAMVTLLLANFVWMTVEVKGGIVTWSFGLGIFKKKLDLKEVRELKITKTPWYYGYGIRKVPGGWLYNVGGPWSVECLRENGKATRIGTDEPEKLLAVLSDQMPPSPTDAPDPQKESG